MCFYDSYVMACNCGKWGHFRQHCSKGMLSLMFEAPGIPKFEIVFVPQYRTGETCGMKLVMNRYSKPEKCKICTKIDTKQRGIVKEEDKIRRWKRETNRVNSIEKAEETIEALKQDLQRLIQERENKRNSLNCITAKD
ncbi:hypothetical protein MBM_08153 [Drepanopeziza brunnea f. sp. 'multigermtubi' MB_m1]|uniref:Uncharacterized protein n=1 Tax=Marssonina brunnea f. sp. multigermtubi (strain MB_m1) TaxID=1072389 RepID=K1WNM0_MARBU|nr:uncharacterized protein MBM_08153 [Drepanopeziza brunnea f. sp. 'multigermtubi' MB_m1]EKD13952.1 hypothetical protein MBM_08153 [Drepanopeziza brunnea f. sp. 'multigermtubi' MB_m1]